MNTESQKKIWSQFFEIMQNYFEENQNKSTPVVEYHNGQDLRDILKLNIQDDALTDEDFIEEIKKYLKYAVRTTHPQFNNQLYGGFAFESLIAEVLTFITDTSMATFEIAPVGTLIEDFLIKELNKLTGFANSDTGGDGIMLTGGSNANMMAIHCARQRRFPNIKEKGSPKEDICVFVSKEAHYSFKKAAILLGIGTDNLVLVNSHESGSMDPVDLEAKILRAKNDGKIPLMIASTAGTTVLGAFDPVEKNNEIAKKYDMWHHVDGAWGGVSLFNEELTPNLKGLDHADSFTFDAHKLLGTGIVTSFFLTREKGMILNANCGGGKEYLFHEYENAEFDTGRGSLQCGRKVESLKFWFLWKALGRKGLEEIVAKQLEKTRFFTDLIKENPRLKLIREPQSFNVCFQVLPTDESLDVNEYNLSLRFKLVKQGNFLVNYSQFDDGTTFFRFVFANTETKFEDLEYFLSELVKLSNE